MLPRTVKSISKNKVHRRQTKTVVIYELLASEKQVGNILIMNRTKYIILVLECVVIREIFLFQLKRGVELYRENTGALK